MGIEAFDFFSSDASEIQQVVDQVPHVSGGAENAIEEAMTFGGQFGHVFLFQDAGKAIDVAERSTKVVGNGIAESFEFGIGPDQLGGTLVHAGLERGIERGNFALPAAKLGIGRGRLGGALGNAVFQEFIRVTQFLFEIAALGSIAGNFCKSEELARHRRAEQ